MKELINNNKTIVIFIVFILIVLILVIGLSMFFKPNSKSAYGDRLDGIEKVKITNDRINEVKGVMEANNLTKQIDININGKIINVIYQVNDEVDMAKAKEIAGLGLAKFSDSEKKFYDIQFIAESKKTDATYTIFGYKNSSSDNIIWTNNK